ncbi:Uncharacterised protein [Streptococcus pneumoniae]|nr:Uncharacterised protein [Streptococcus pneumoniae]
MRIATGLIAGPDNPPVRFAKIGLAVFKSRRIPSNVLIIVKPSAPAFSIAFAISTMFATFGDNFTYTGTSETSFTRFVKSAAISGFVPKAIPPVFTFGQEMFNSSAWTLGALEISFATAT